MKKAISISFVTLLLNSVCTFAQSDVSGTQKEFSTAYDTYIQKTLEKIPDIPGIAIVVIKDNKPIFVRAYGMADKESGTKADTDTLFYIASSTKAFTALAASMLDRESKIKFGDPVVKYTDGIRFKSVLPDKISVRDLLTHTSGLRNDALVNRMAFSGQIDPTDMARVFANGTTATDANFGKYQYTNLGYNIYGILIENNLKKKWQDLLQQRVFDPLGMKHTTAYPSKAASKRWKLAAPYVFDASAGKTVRSTLNKTDNNMQSAGGIFTSASDMGRWLNMNMNGGKLNGKQVIPTDLVRAAQIGYTKTTRENPPFTGEGEYGLGWQIGKYRNEKVIYHHGGFPGYSSHVSFLPDKKIAVAVMTNEGTVGSRVGDLLATYALDWWLRTENAEANYLKQLDDLVAAYSARKQQSTAQAADRAKRTWQLTKPFADYAGKYTNEIFGTIEIIAGEKSLLVRMGNINSVATPFTAKDSIRVEMLPGGNGEVINFQKNAAEQFVSLNYAGVTFTKVSG